MGKNVLYIRYSNIYIYFSLNLKKKIKEIRNRKKTTGNKYLKFISDKN